MPTKTISPYETPGRLADVIAAVTMLATDPNSENWIENIAFNLSRLGAYQLNDPRLKSNPRWPIEKKRWTEVFEEHPEFFMAFAVPDDERRKAALRLRISNRSIDKRTGQPFPPGYALTDEDYRNRTSTPLDVERVGNLIVAAIELHKSALATRQDSRWFWQNLIAPAFGLVGVLAGAILSSISTHKQDSPQKTEIYISPSTLGVLDSLRSRAPQQRP